MDHAHFGPERNDIAVVEAVVDGDGVSREPGKDGSRRHREQSVLQRTRGRRRARNDVRLQPVHGDRNVSSRYQLGEAAGVVGVSVGDNYPPDPVR